MKQEVLNEVNQMKYLFGYKAGKVISEQVNPPQPSEPKPSGTTIDGVVYLLPGITDLAKLQAFKDIGKSVDFGKSFGVDNDYIKNHEESMKQAQDPNRTTPRVISPLNRLRNVTMDALDYLAQNNYGPEKLKTPQVQNYLLSRYDNELKNLLGWEVVDRPGLSPSKENRGLLGQELYFQRLGELLNRKINELK